MRWSCFLGGTKEARARKLGKSGTSLFGLADYEYEVIKLEWQKESLITNSNPDLFGNCGDFDTVILTGQSEDLTTLTT